MTRAAHDLAHSRLVDAVPRTPSGICDRRVLQHPTDAWLPFFVAPTSSELAISPEQFTAGLRFYLLLPLLLRLPTAPAVVDVPAPGARLQGTRRSSSRLLHASCLVHAKLQAALL